MWKAFPAIMFSGLSLTHIYYTRLEKCARYKHFNLLLFVHNFKKKFFEYGLGSTDYKFKLEILAHLSGANYIVIND